MPELMPELGQERFSLLGVCRTERPENGGAGCLDGIVCWLTKVLEAIFGVAVSSLEVRVARPSILCCLKERLVTQQKIVVSSVQIEEKTKKYRCLTFEILPRKKEKKNLTKNLRLGKPVL